MSETDAVRPGGSRTTSRPAPPRQTASGEARTADPSADKRGRLPGPKGEGGKWVMASPNPKKAAGEPPSWLFAPFWLGQEEGELVPVQALKQLFQGGVDTRAGGPRSKLGRMADVL
jgi:hypothetical protein